MKFKIKSLLIIALLLTGCSAPKRMNRLIKHHPELLSKTDTIKFTDTITFKTERVFRDSIYLISDARNDTVIIKEKNLTIRTFIKGDTVYSYGECDTDTVTIIKEFSIPHKVVEYKESKSIPWKFIVTFILVFIVVRFISEYIRNNSRFS